MTNPYSPYLILLLSLFACAPQDNSPHLDRETIVSEITQMFDDYHHDIREKGLTAEFKYLDQSNDFFWVPPGYESALSFDSVKTILETNAGNFSKIEFRFESLQIFPLTRDIANYSGIVSGSMTDTAGNITASSIIESGTLIKRPDGWKLLSGQSANLLAD